MVSNYYYKQPISGALYQIPGSTIISSPVSSPSVYVGGKRKYARKWTMAAEDNRPVVVMALDVELDRYGKATDHWKILHDSKVYILHESKLQNNVVTP